MLFVIHSFTRSGQKYRQLCAKEEEKKDLQQFEPYLTPSKKFPCVPMRSIPLIDLALGAAQQAKPHDILYVPCKGKAILQTHMPTLEERSEGS